MLYLAQINPFLETIFYLANRFAEGRTAYLLEGLKKSRSDIPNEYLDYYERIAELEAKLDAEFESSGIIEEYFMPLGIKDVERELDPLSVGRILLSLPKPAPIPYSIDDLISFYRSADIKEIFAHFGETLNVFNDKKKRIQDLNTLVATIDDLIAAPEDKWKIIDALTDPAGHLERLRDTVNAISERIMGAAGEFSGLLDECYSWICSSTKKMRDRLMSFEGIADDNVTFVPSLLRISVYSSIEYENNKLLLVLGVYVYNAFKSKANWMSEDRFIYVLKALSDITRLRVLHSLCDEYSYGQKLSEQYNSTPNALYYHLDKLLSCSLIQVKETEYRTLYTMNKRAVYDNLTNLRDYLLNGWKPEDEAQTETPEAGGESGAEE